MSAPACDPQPSLALPASLLAAAAWPRAADGCDQGLHRRRHVEGHYSQQDYETR